MVGDGCGLWKTRVWRCKGGISLNTFRLSLSPHLPQGFSMEICVVRRCVDRTDTILSRKLVFTTLGTLHTVRQYVPR
jgi:hypothetical protein